MEHAQAAALIVAALDDGGASILEEAGLGADWVATLAMVPAVMLPECDEGIELLTWVRDFWSQARLLGPAAAATRGLLRHRIARQGKDHPDTLLELGALGALSQRMGQRDEAERLLEQAYQGLRSTAGNDLRTAVVAANLGVLRVAGGQLREADEALTHAYRVRTRVAPASTGVIAAQLGEVRLQRGRQDEALELLREAWMKHLDQLGPEHPRTLARARTLGALLNRLGHYREAAPVLRDVYHYAQAGGSAEDVAHAAFELGLALDHTWKKEEGLRLVEHGLRWTRATGGPKGPHPLLPERLAQYAHFQIERRRPAEAEGLLLESLEAERQLHGDNSAEVAARHASLGYFCARMGREQEAIGWLDPAASVLRSTVGDDDPRTERVVRYLVGLVKEQVTRAHEGHDRALAEHLIARAEALAVPVLGHGSREAADLRQLAAKLSGRSR